MFWLPEGQARVLKAVARIAREEHSPTAHDLLPLLAIRHQSLRQHLEALAAKGYVVLYPQGRGRPTHIELTPVGRLATGLAIPLLGRIAAGRPAEAWEEVEAILPLPGRPGLFALKVHGDSMAEFFLDGDIVVVERGPAPRPGEIAAVMHQGETTLKYVCPEGDRVILRPHNPLFPTLELPSDEVEIQGVYRFLLRGEEALRAFGLIQTFGGAR